MKQECQNCKNVYDSEGHPNGTWLTFCLGCNEKLTPNQKKEVSRLYKNHRGMDEMTDEEKEKFIEMDMRSGD